MGALHCTDVPSTIYSVCLRIHPISIRPAWLPRSVNTIACGPSNRVWRSVSWYTICEAVVWRDAARFPLNNVRLVDGARPLSSPVAVASRVHAPVFSCTTHATVRSLSPYGREHSSHLALRSSGTQNCSKGGPPSPRFLLAQPLVPCPASHPAHLNGRRVAQGRHHANYWSGVADGIGCYAP